MTKDKILGIISVPLVFMPAVLHAILEMLFKNQQWWNFYLYYAIACFISIMIFILLKLLFNFKLSDIGFTSFKWSYLGWAILGFILGGMTYYGLSLLLTNIGIPKTSNWGMDIKYENIFQFILIIIYAVIAAPIVEEIFFRGLIISYFGKLTKNWIAGIISVLLFTFYHYLGFGLYIGILFIPIAIIPTVLFLWKKSIIPGLIWHMINNFFVFVVLSLLNQ